MNLVELVLIPLILMGISLYVGVRQGRNQMKEEFELEAKANLKKESKAVQNLKNTILNEVVYNVELLSQSYITDKYGHRKYLYLLFRDAFNNALATENYNSLSALMQKAVSSYYGGIDRWNELVNKYEGEERNLVLQGIFNEHNALETALKDLSTDLKELLKSEDSQEI